MDHTNTLPPAEPEPTAREIAREDRDYWNDRYDIEPAA